MTESVLEKCEIKMVARDPKLIPQYQSEGASGADIVADITQEILLMPGERVLVPTGLFCEIPKGYEVQIRSRSGLAIKFGITVLNSPGTIDSDYRGEIKVALINLGKDLFHILPEMRIAQMVIAQVPYVCFTQVRTLCSSNRGDGGFGHTGH